MHSFLYVSYKGQETGRGGMEDGREHMRLDDSRIYELILTSLLLILLLAASSYVLFC